MKSRTKFTSLMLLLAMLLSLVPAVALPAQASAATCYQAQFVSDVTVPDGTRFDPDTAFKKTWRLKNIGTCTWNTNDVSMVFDSGTQLGAPASVAMPATTAPGSTVDITVDMKAPSGAGHYIGYWKFKTSQGTIFGIGINANRSWWVDINVNSSGTGSVILDFAATAEKATWTSGAGGLTFPGKDGDAKGFALRQDKPKYESGVVGTQPALLFVPQQITNGFIQAEYPSYKVDPADKFQTTVGCEAGATTCYVAYRLDYKSAGVVKTFWSFRERFEGLTYTASISLAPLAGKDVSFILYISSYGSPVGDRALWGAPVILRPGIVPPPITGTPPTPTSTSTPGTITPTIPPSTSDKAQFVADVNVPDGTTMQPGAQFTKTWRLKNVGTSTWKKGTYMLVFSSGNQMGGASSLAFPQDVAPGTTINISVTLTAPSAAGSYRGYWMFKNASGALFGIGTQANQPWWVDIKVAGPTVTPGGPTLTPTVTNTPGGPTATPVAGNAYDFASNACKDAKWFSGSGALTCPGTDGDAKGFVLQVTNPKLETGATDTRPGLITFPQNIQNGYIQGFYPAFAVKNGDRFRSIINCESGATNCYVAFRLDYALEGSSTVKTIWGPFLERYEGQYYSVDVDLSSLAGQNVKFILTVLAAGTASGDRALWVGPMIYRVGGATASNTPVATISATAAPTTYKNTKYGFGFSIPTGSTIASQTDTAGRVNLPFAAGTNLQEKYVQINVVENADPCVSPLLGTQVTATNVTINNITFAQQTSTEGAAGNIYDTVAYSTVHNNACISLSFVLHAANPNNFPNPPPAYDKNAESAAFTTIINSFNWLP